MISLFILHIFLHGSDYSFPWDYNSDVQATVITRGLVLSTI